MQQGGKLIACHFHSFIIFIKSSLLSFCSLLLAMMSATIGGRLELLSFEKHWTWNSKSWSLDVGIQELTLQQLTHESWVKRNLNWTSLKLIMFFISFPLPRFLFSCFCLNRPDSKCFNFLCLCCYVFIKIFALWMIHESQCMHYLFIFFVRMHNAHYVDHESWLINMSLWSIP